MGSVGLDRTAWGLYVVLMLIWVCWHRCFDAGGGAAW